MRASKKPSVLDRALYVYVYIYVVLMVRTLGAPRTVLIKSSAAHILMFVMKLNTERPCLFVCLELGLGLRFGLCFCFLFLVAVAAAVVLTTQV